MEVLFSTTVNYINAAEYSQWKLGNLRKCTVENVENIKVKIYVL